MLATLDQPSSKHLELAQLRWNETVMYYVWASGMDQDLVDGYAEMLVSDLSITR